MTFRRRGLELLNDWAPGEWFDPDHDRLLVTTSCQQSFVVSSGPEGDDGTTLIIDNEFMPRNLKEVAHVVRRSRTFPLDWDVTQYPWSIFVFDGEMTRNGPWIEMFGAGIGWTMPIGSEITVETITPITRSDIDRRDLSLTIEGLTFGQPTLNEDAIYEEALRMV